MNNNKKISCSNCEPIYDDWTIEEQAEHEIIELLTALVDHILKLQDEVVSLRKAHYIDNPYADVYSDMCPSFEDFSAYWKYREILQRLS